MSSNHPSVSSSPLFPSFLGCRIPSFLAPPACCAGRVAGALCGVPVVCAVVSLDPPLDQPLPPRARGAGYGCDSTDSMSSFVPGLISAVS